MLLGACSSAKPPVFCEDARNTVVELTAPAAVAPQVAAVTASGTGCAADAVACVEPSAEGCLRYQVEVSLASDSREGVCTIDVTYLDATPTDHIETHVSISDCGPIAGVDGTSHFTLPVGG